MDIAILLALQDFRNGPGALLGEFLKKMTFFGELNTALVIFALVYWCISKEWGTYLMMGWSGNRIINGALKVTVCAYRPWIRDPRIVPYGDSMTTATGYSFPSGHTTNAGTVFGGGAVRRDFPRALRAVLFLIVALVGFSRLYLGVHTPQDVLVGAAYSLLVMWLTLKLMRWLEEHPEKEMLVVCIGIGISVLLALYAGLKSYPEDFDGEGQLIVDGVKMANDTFKAVGWVSAFLIGWVAERRWVGFSTEVPRMTKVTRCVVGLLGFYGVSLLLMPLIKEALSGPAGTMLSCFVQMLYISFLFPWCMMRMEQKPR
jgi:undecaprenyl-diphosphatase